MRAAWASCTQFRFDGALSVEVVVDAVVVQLAKLVAERLPLVVGPLLLAEEYTVSPTMRFNLDLCARFTFSLPRPCEQRGVA
jgi:hypothetical protein